MGIYINMEMPTSCDMCWALDDYGDYPRCRITEEQRGYNFPIRQKRMDNCPLAPVPPHGDLVDRDALIKELEIDDLDDRTGAALLMAVFIEVLKSAPTIIPAEIISENEIKIIDTKGKPNYDPKRRFVIPAEEGE